VDCLPADKPWDVVSVTRRSSGGVAPQACVRVYTRVLVPPNLYIHTWGKQSLFRLFAVQTGLWFWDGPRCRVNLTESPNSNRSESRG